MRTERSGGRTLHGKVQPQHVIAGNPGTIGSRPDRVQWFDLERGRKIVFRAECRVMLMPLARREERHSGTAAEYFDKRALPVAEGNDRVFGQRTRGDGHYEILEVGDENRAALVVAAPV